MSLLFEDLEQGLEEAIEYEKGKGKARVKKYSDEIEETEYIVQRIKVGYDETVSDSEGKRGSSLTFSRY